MPTYFRKTIKLLPWVTLNLNKSGASLSIGPRGAKLNISKKGVYFNSSIPGTGVYNKTKVGASLLWALLTFIIVGVIGYLLGVALQNFTLFVGMLVLGLACAIVAFFVSKHFAKKEVVAVDEDMEEEPAPRKRSTGNKTSSRKTSSRGSATKSTATKSARRTDNAPAKAYISEVEQLVEEMAEADTVKALNKAHAEILDIMYTNIKPLGVKVMGMEFDEALATIEQEYATGLKELTANEG